ncbi:MAG: hypothetical protein ABEI98_11990 [Halorhabdus sp.]
MKRRTLLTSAATMAAAGVAGCSGNNTSDLAETTDNTPMNSEASTSPTKTPTQREAVLSTLENVYAAWASLDADAFLALLYSTNNHPEEQVRTGAKKIDFNGQLVDYEATINGSPNEKELTNFFETTGITEEEQSVFNGVKKVLVQWDPVVEGKATTDQAKSFKEFLNMQKTHMLAVNDDKWRFVG